MGIGATDNTMENEKTDRLYPGNLIRICLERWSNHEFSVKAYNNCIEGALEFSDYSDFLLKAENLFDSMAYPQAFEESRHFGDSGKNYPSFNWNGRPKGMADREIAEKSGTAATFNLVVETRKKSDWQGILQDADGHILAPFSSTIELENILEKIRNTNEKNDKMETLL